MGLVTCESVTGSSCWCPSCWSWSGAVCPGSCYGSGYLRQVAAAGVLAVSPGLAQYVQVVAVGRLVLH